MSFHDKLKLTRAAASRGKRGWKPREGANKIRVLPPRSRYLTSWEEMENVALQSRVHYFKFEKEKKDVSDRSLCLKAVKQNCPACDAFWEYHKSEDKGLQELARQVRPSDQYLFNILDINNLQAGIQPWSANHTCWDTIMEIAANPQWGNVIDPFNGRNFDITMTPGKQTKNGFNDFSVFPEPGFTTVEGVLAAIPNWQSILDELENQMFAPKNQEEIVELLAAMGFPSAGGVRVPTMAIQVPPGAVAPVGVQPVIPVPVAIPGVAAVPVAAPVPIAAPAPVSVAAPEPRPSVAQVFSPGTSTTPVNAVVHYEPGEHYTPKVNPLPAGVPRCFGDYQPTIHQCRPCPAKSDCQLRTLGIE